MSEPIGKKICQLRSDMKVAEQELAQAANMEVAQLKRIESGEINPSLTTLIKIARRLGVRVGTILDGNEHTNPVVTTKEEGRVLLNNSNGSGGERNNLNFLSLAQNKKDRNMEPFIVNISYSPEGAPTASSHEGEEFLYVLEGDVTIFYGNRRFDLSEGDSIYYDSIVQHLVTTPAPDRTAKVLAVTYAPC
ncbi:MAG: cupin domain-containing protein [Rikenellaceae bacterium]|jgi:transcriptional regulator with XRE-family HTH domain|nr:cupin domain-containing protein [Rikenellaceae bacterium]